MAEFKSDLTSEDLTTPHKAQAEESGYARWKELKINQAIEQARDRESLVPANDVWKSFGFER